MKTKILTLNLSLCLVAQNGFAQTPEGEAKGKPSGVYRVPEGGSFAISQKDAVKNSTAIGDSASAIIQDLTILGLGAFAGSIAGAYRDRQAYRSERAERELLDASKYGLARNDYDAFLYSEPRSGNGLKFANDLKDLKNSAFDLADKIEESEVFQNIPEGPLEKDTLEKFKKSMVNTNTDEILDKSKVLKKKIQEFTERYPTEIKKLEFPKMDDLDLEKLNNLKKSLVEGVNTLDKFDFEAVREKLNMANGRAQKVIQANQTFLEATANKKIANSIRNLRKGAAPSGTMRALKAAGWAGATFIAVDIYGNILNMTSDNPKPVQFPGQLGAEILKGTPEAIFEAARKRIEQRPDLGRGTVDELDPTNPPKGH